MSNSIDKYYYWQKDALYLNVYIQPRANKNEIIGLYNNRLKIRITAPPVDDKANTALIAFIAKYLNVPKKQVTLVNGEHSRYKLLRIIGLKNDLQFPQ
jgi:uncharacterized protein